MLRRLWRKLGFSQRAHSDDAVLVYHVRCNKCGEVVRVRIHEYNDLSLDDEGGRFCHKTVVGSRCYARMQMTLRFDPHFREIERSVQGGKFVDAA
ncbi:MAG: hypothetical protein ACK4WM_04575 [Thermoflexales bacterium]